MRRPRSCRRLGVSGNGHPREDRRAGASRGPDDLAEKLIHLLRDPDRLRRMGRNAPKKSWRDSRGIRSWAAPG